MKTDIETKEKSFPKFKRVLFWDTRLEDIDPVKHKKWIVSRIMHRGWIDDFRKIEEYYGKEEILNLIPEIRWQDSKTEHYFTKVYN